MSKKKLIIKVKEIKGNCPIFKIGDTIFIENGYILRLEKPICMHSLTSIMPYYVALSRGIKPQELGLGKDNKAYVQC
ncbi:MAG TPA: TIGR04076 family protein, partial [Candidatus Desulfofervidus auxilii]|nr:TIGR04076 family protein [Candidatus Desulfofervidus auxilii]